jgi:hypothetical protein
MQQLSVNLCQKSEELLSKRQRDAYIFKSNTCLACLGYATKICHGHLAISIYLAHILQHTKIIRKFMIIRKA